MCIFRMIMLAHLGQEKFVSEEQIHLETIVVFAYDSIL